MFEAVPEHQSLFDHGHRCSDCEQLPVPPMIDNEVVEPKQHRQDAGADTRDARRAQAMNQEAFVEEAHCSLSNLKISSVPTPKICANRSASSRLGTYRLRSIELML